MDESDDDSQLMALIDEELTKYQLLTALICQYWVPFISKQPRRSSIRSGHIWVQELLSDNGNCKDMLRVDNHVFYLLCNKLAAHGLTQSRHVGIEEMVAMFLLTVGHAMGNRVVQELFQHSGETVSRLLHKVLKACLRLASENIKPIDPEFCECHPHVLHNARYYPYFKDAIGAIDGTHIRCVVTSENRDKYIGRKGYPTQNVIAVCDWDMCFTFVLAGWEGSAHDARVFQAAVSNPATKFPHPPPGKYYLVDSGYPMREGYLGPYRRERYHVPEFRRQPVLRNNNEKFNFFHSSLRSMIERTFGIWKSRFAILQRMRTYSYETQVRLVCATMAIHNFIRRNSPGDSTFQDDLDDNEGEEEGPPVEEEGSSTNNAGPSSGRMNAVRDRIRDAIAEDI